MEELIRHEYAVRVIGWNRVTLVLAVLCLLAVLMAADLVVHGG